VWQQRRRVEVLRVLQTSNRRSFSHGDCRGQYGGNVHSGYTTDPDVCEAPTSATDAQILLWTSPPPAAANGLAVPAAPNRNAAATLSFHGSAQQAIPSMVNIFTAKRLRRNRRTLSEGGPLERFFGAPREQPRAAMSLGSGVIVSRDGLFLANIHVIERADEIAVVLQGSRRASATGCGTSWS
jgi:S1-C subfamily serine protease